MGAGRLGHGRTKKPPINVGDLVLCKDPSIRDDDGTMLERVGLVLDTSLTICKIQVLKSSKIMYFPLCTTYPYEEDID